jgi:hypothetical protein
MTKRTLLLMLLNTFLISACSSNPTEDNSDGSTNENHLVKKEIIHNSAYIEYIYDENDLLIQIDDIWNEEDIDTHHFYTYDSNENIIEVISNTLNDSNTDTFAYDGNNRLISLNSENAYYNRTYTYTDNIITVANSTNDIYILEINSFGLISKLTSINSYYSLINYDSNKNIKEINTYDINNNLKSNIIYTFDDKPNPFYGMLKSLYVHQFLSAFRDADYGEIVYDGYDGYWFPFLKNNITSVERTIINEYDSTDYYFYEYDESNYPTRIFDSAGGLNESNYYIEYY